MCSPGYTGESCGIDTCDGLNKCNSNGVCKNAQCFCSPGWEGDDCSKEMKCPDNCGGNGVCKYGKCFCDPGHEGDDCSGVAKCEDDCNAHGVCNGGKCLCELGWAGDTCGKLKSLKSCPNDCGGEARGLCRAGVCYCNPGFMGASCDDSMICPGEIDGNIFCEGHGECLYGECFCHPGYAGKDCSEKKACPKDCSGNGQCFDGACECKPGYHGEACGEADKCLNDCSHHGFCFKQKCFCNTGFLGEDCSVSADKLKEEERQKHCGEGCSGHGVCGYGMLSFETSAPLARCLCQPGFSGDYCEVAHLCQGQCNGHGECVNGKCICECGYIGEGCEHAALASDACPKDCFGHGDCVLGQCFCNPGRAGELCETETECPFGTNGMQCSGAGQCKWGRCFCSEESNSESCSPTSPGKKLELEKKVDEKKDIKVDEKKDIKVDEKKAEIDQLAADRFSAKKVSGMQGSSESSSMMRFAGTNTPEAKCDNNCSLNGLCKFGKCDCFPGWQGSSCVEAVRCPLDCSKKGLCQFGQCFCNPGFQGNGCEDVILGFSIASVDARVLADSSAGLRHEAQKTGRTVTFIAAVVGSAMAFVLGTVLGTLIMWHQQNRTRARAMEFLSLKEDIGMDSDFSGAGTDHSEISFAPPIPQMPPMPHRPSRMT